MEHPAAQRVPRRDARRRSATSDFAGTPHPTPLPFPIHWCLGYRPLAPSLCPLFVKRTSSSRSQIAVEGCCHGELDKIYGTIEHARVARGVTVDLLICCGDFQVSRRPLPPNSSSRGPPAHAGCRSPPTPANAGRPQPSRSIDDGMPGQASCHEHILQVGTCARFLHCRVVNSNANAGPSHCAHPRRYYSGEKVAPVLTIFIGGNHEASNHSWELPYGGWWVLGFLSFFASG